MLFLSNVEKVTHNRILTMTNSILKNLLILILFIILSSFSSCMDVQGGDIESSETIDLSKNWRFSPDEKNVGFSGKWYSVSYNDSQWDQIDAGESWENQGYPNLDSFGWYRKTVNIPANWKGKDVWLKFSGVNDSYRLFVNGELLTSFGDVENTVFNSNTISEVGRVLAFGQENLITVQVNDWGNSGGLWLPVVITVNENEVDSDFVIFPFINYDKNILLLNTNLAPYIGKEIDCDRVNITVWNEEGTSLIAKHEQKLANGKRTFLARIDMPRVDEKTGYGITIEIIGYHDEIILTLSKKVEWNLPSLRPDKNGVVKLNNMVCELLNKGIHQQETAHLKFYNPREGWVFFSIEIKNNNPSAKLNKNSTLLVWRINPENGAKEAMQYLNKGEHILNVDQATNSQVVVRSVPELIYSDHPSVPHIRAYGSYDWDYLEKYVLSNVNTVVTSATTLKDSERNQWIKEGRKWIVHAGLPGLADTIAPSVEEVYKTWSKSIGTTDSRLNGIIVDEFMHGGSRTAEHFNVWKEALTSLYKSPDFSGKRFYAYCTPIFGYSEAMAIPFGKELVRNGGCFALERYLNEKPTEEDAYNFLFDELSHKYKTMTKSLGVNGQKWIIALGYLTDHTETLSYYPFVDYRVYMDMQMHLLATDPTFNNLYGVQEYKADYADEELIRWAHKLYRHYFIEGNRTRLTDDPYILPYIENSFFTRGLQGWTVEQAEEGSIQLQSMEGFSWIQGLYPRTNIGDQFIRFKRSAKKPNTIRQTINELEPGRLYSLKFIAIDKNSMDKKQKLALSIKLDGVEILKEPTFHYIYPSNYGHEFGNITRDNPAWFNLYRIVFRPKNKTAELTISDWSNSTQSNDLVGQEIIFNFVEIQPYYANTE